MVVNPNSQNGALGKRWTEVARVLRREYGSFDALVTRGPGDATTLARDALKQGADLVVAVGGDGTIHEVTNGFFDDDDRPVRPEAALGIVPFGTGGDFRKTAGIPRETTDAARVLKRGTRRTIDVGCLHYARGGKDGPRARRIFINIASFGIGGLVDRFVNNTTKIFGGKVSFFLGTARAAVQYRNQRVKIVFDGNEDDHLQATINNVAVANGQFFGGGMHIAPNAVLDDGKFDIVILGDLTPMDFLKDGYRVYRGTHLAMPKVSCRRATRVEALAVNPDDEILLDVDGEAPGALPATFSLLPQALNVVVPA